MSDDSVDTLHVLDSCVWMDLEARHSKLLYKLCDLARLSVVRIGVPEIVRTEVVKDDPDWIEGRKKDWQSRIGELQKFAELLGRTEDAFEKDKPSAKYEETLQSMRESLEQYDGDPHTNMISDLFDSRAVVRISCPQITYKQVVEQGLQKKQPFSNKNGVADALILFSVVRWAKRHPTESVCFHTLNTRDFSCSENKTLPHPDIAEHFAPNTNLSYCTNLGGLAGAVDGIDPYDLYPSSEHGCDLCDGTVLIESITCRRCGAWPSRAPDHEGYTLKSYRGGHLVDVYDIFGEHSYRVSCDKCGRKTFDVELPDLCSYHEHVTSKW